MPRLRSQVPSGKLLLALQPIIRTAGSSSGGRAGRHPTRRTEMTAWIVRAGRLGEREDWALAEHVAGGGFHELDDLSKADSKDKVKAAVRQAYPDAVPGAQYIFAGQMWALGDTITAGDVIVMPMKTTKK